ncbi:hypothetical protein KEM55_005266 [Ascosphaera atra]|nr:hypothetical protein KEM55_005266 [Ascosphaera atra]
MHIHVKATLAMVEDRHHTLTPTLITVIDNEKGGSEPSSPVQSNTTDIESGAAPRAPATSFIRTIPSTLKTGASTIFRGLKMHILLNMMRFMVFLLLQGLLTFLTETVQTNLFSFAATMVFADVLLTRWHVAFVHAIMSKENAKGVWARVCAVQRPCAPAMRRATASVFLCSVVEITAAILPVKLFQIYNPFVSTDNAKEDSKNLMWFSLKIMGVATLLELLLVVPATVTKARVAASVFAAQNLKIKEQMRSQRVVVASPKGVVEVDEYEGELPEDTLLPFDPTFGGTVEEGEVIGLLDAWKSFEWPSRRQVLKYFGLAAAIHTALLVVP